MVTFTNNHKGFIAATQFLIRLGHRREQLDYMSRQEILNAANQLFIQKQKEYEANRQANRSKTEGDNEERSASGNDSKGGNAG